MWVAICQFCGAMRAEIPIKDEVKFTHLCPSCKYEKYKVAELLTKEKKEE